MAEEIPVTSEVNIPQLLAAQKAFFEAGKTLDVQERIVKLKVLKKLIEDRERIFLKPYTRISESRSSKQWLLKPP